MQQQEMSIPAFLFKGKKVQFKTVTARTASCACCGYEVVPIPCDAKKVWEFENNTLMVYHCGNHSCVAKKPSADVTKEPSHFFHENTYAKPSQFPQERLRGMLKDGKNIAEIYDEAKGMANLKKMQNIEQKVVNKENPAGHSFDALAKIKESSDKMDKYLLCGVKDGRLGDMMDFVQVKNAYRDCNSIAEGKWPPVGR